MLWIWLGIQVSILIVLFSMAGKRYEEEIKPFVEHFQLSFMAPASLHFVRRIRLRFRFQRFSGKVHKRIISLFGIKHAQLLTELFLAQIVSGILIMLVAFTVLAIVMEQNNLAAAGLLIGILMPLLMSKDLEKKQQQKQQQMLLELPEFLNKITLLINAGGTVQDAIVRSVERMKDDKQNYLYAELSEVVSELRNQSPLHVVLEDFSRRCGIQEVSIFTTTILLNYKRGGNELVAALQQLSHTLWEKRKAISRKLGEEASSKLIFPMVVTFLVVMVIVGAPAIFMME